MPLDSYTITQGRDRAPARAMLKGIGFTDADLAKPIIGVANTWIETMPCNYNLRELAVKVKEGIRAAGGTPMEFNTIAISDGVTMGTEGMKASLVSREVIADSIELVARGHMFDGMVALVACDKTIPGAAMALLRLNVPSVILYGGSILPGRHNGRDITIQDVFEAVGANAAGRMSDQELLEIENHACPGAGACGGQFTANTMATVLELIGLSPMGTAAVPQVDARKNAVSFRCGEIVMDAVRHNRRPREIATRAAFANAIAGVAATGGSTNAVLHLLAMAREAGVALEIDDFQEICRRTPVLVDIKPGGRFVAVDVDKAGGIGVIAQRLVEGGYVDGSVVTCTGRTFAAEVTSEEMTTGSVGASEAERKWAAGRTRWWNSTGGGSFKDGKTVQKGNVKAGDGGAKFRAEWPEMDKENWKWMKENRIDPATGNVMQEPGSSGQGNCSPGMALRRPSGSSRSKDIIRDMPKPMNSITAKARKLTYPSVSCMKAVPGSLKMLPAVTVADAMVGSIPVMKLLT